MHPVLIDLVNAAETPGRVFASKEDTVESLYSQWCLHFLSTDFNRVRMADFRSGLKYHMGKL
eukprot:c27630_g1_i1 orf=194-379(+)